MEKDLQRYVRWQRSVGHSFRTWETHKLYVGYFIQWLQHKGYSTDSADIHVEIVREWIEDMQDKGLSDATVNTRVRSLRAFTHWLAVEEWLPKDPLARLKPPRVEDKPRDVLTPEQVDAVLATCNRSTVNGLRDVAIILMLYSTGIRVSELLTSA